MDIVIGEFYLAEGVRLIRADKRSRISGCKLGYGAYFLNNGELAMKDVPFLISEKKLLPLNTSDLNIALKIKAELLTRK